jgi:hypothetical protein
LSPVSHVIVPLDGQLDFSTSPGPPVGVMVVMQMFSPSLTAPTVKSSAIKSPLWSRPE